jgi:hypothetical protein
MFNRLFGKPKEQANASALATLDKLNEVKLSYSSPFYDLSLDSLVLCALSESYLVCLNNSIITLLLNNAHVPSHLQIYWN